MKKFDSKRKGFTLVELLIVIVVIGILSAMMMLSSSEAVSSARATTIVADMRNIKTAALAYYTDNIDTADTTDPTMKLIKPYLTTGKEAASGGTAVDGYDIKVAKGQGWFVEYTISGTNKEKIKTKLAGRAKSTGLLKNEVAEPATDDYYTGTTATSLPDTVYMFVR